MTDAELLSALLEAWRKRPAPEFTAAIDVVSARLAARAEPLSTKPTQIAAWLERGRKKVAADLPLLLERLGEGTSAPIRARLGVLAEWPSDPRIDARLLDAVHTPLSPGVAGRSVMLTVFTLLERSNDPRVRDRLVAFADGEPPYVVPRVRKLSAAVLRVFEETVARLRTKKYPAAQLDAAGKKWLSELPLQREAPLAKRDGDALLRAVYADPADDSARLVYADWLTEQGDERGEFITLQVQRAQTGAEPSKRERQLEKKWARAWLGPLQPVLLKRDLVYRRGFLAECALEAMLSDHAKLIGHPIFSTVEKFDLASGRMGAPDWVNAPSCKAVVSIVELSTSSLERVTRQVKHLGLRYFSGRPEVFEWLKKQTALEVLELDAIHRRIELLAFARAHPTLRKILAPGVELTREKDFA